MKKYAILVVSFLLFTCGDKEDSDKVSFEKMMKFKEEVMEKQSIEFDWYGEEMYKKQFSNDYEEVLQSDKQLATYYDILDIFKADGDSFLLIDMDEYIFQLKVDAKDLTKTIELSKVKFNEKECLLIIHIDELSKNKEILIPNSLFQDTDTSMVRFFGRGSLLDIKCLNN
ncbi:MAG: hypothetical protein R2797_01910 [Gelidibacter sp.]